MGIPLNEIKDSKLRETVLRLDLQQNPKRRFVGGLDANGAKPPQVRALDAGVTKHKGGKGGVVCRVTCIAVRKRLLDPDSIAFTFKPLTDSIAKTLGVDDADPRIRWEYHQIKTEGQTGSIVKIECL